jgi:hypothetical protein
VVAQESESAICPGRDENAIFLGAPCKTVGLAYVGSNPTLATQNSRSDPVPAFPDAGSDACPGAVRQTVPGCCGPVVGQIWPGQRGGRDGCLGRLSGAAIRGPGLADRYFRRSGASNLIWVEAPGPAVARTHDGRDSRGLHRFLWASGGQWLGLRASSMCWLAIWSQPGMQCA